MIPYFTVSLLTVGESFLPSLRNIVGETAKPYESQCSAEQNQKVPLTEHPTAVSLDKVAIAWVTTCNSVEIRNDKIEPEQQ